MENRLKQVAMCGKKNVKRKTMNKGYLRRVVAERQRTPEAYSPTPRTRQPTQAEPTHPQAGPAGARSAEPTRRGPQGVSENRKKSVLSRGVRAVKGASVDVRL